MKTWTICFFKGKKRGKKNSMPSTKTKRSVKKKVLLYSRSLMNERETPTSLAFLQVPEAIRDPLGILVHQWGCKLKVFVQKSHWHLWWVKKVYHHCVPAVRQLLRPGRDRRGRHTELIGLVQAEPKISFRKASSNYKAPAIHWAACSTFQGISSAGLSVSSSCQLK